MTEKRLDGYITFKLSDVKFSSPSLKGELLFFFFFIHAALTTLIYILYLDTQMINTYLFNT